MDDHRELHILLATTAIGVVLLGGLFALFNYCTPLQRWLKSDTNSTIIVSQTAMRELHQSITEDYLDQWRKEAHKLVKVTETMTQMRRQEMGRFAPQGDANRKNFEELCATKHKAFTPVDLGRKDLGLADVYAAAVAMEVSLMNDYHDILAAKNAVDGHREPLDAIQQVKMVHPERIELKRTALEAEINRPDERWESFKQQIKSGKTEVLTIVKHAETVLKKAREGDRKRGGEGVTVISDIGGGSTAGKTLNPDQLNVDAAGTTEGPFKATAGHIVGDQVGNATRNIYLNDWYVMGPFDNRFRINRDAAFLPETVVDLDARTIGKEGKILTWEYWRCNKQRIEPKGIADNGVVYYGWTEVYLEKGGEYWVAMGSDDKGKMWLNGKVAWESGNERKPYRADEWVGALEFKEGRNEILFRCENDGGTMGWSMILVVGSL